MAKHARAIKCSAREARAAKRKTRRAHDHMDLMPAVADYFMEAVPSTAPRPHNRRLESLTQAQYYYQQAIQSNIITFGLGPAGTGKTYVCASMAALDFLDKSVTDIIVTRPAITAEEEIGFLPGTEEEKCAPYFEPVKVILEEWLGEGHLEYFIKRKRIRFAPMGFLRGRTFENAFVILDEAQNTTPKQMQLFLTRIGKNCRVVVNGDIDQKDIPGLSGLEDAVKRLVDVQGIGIFKFEPEDIVRSGIVREILLRYAKGK